MPQTQDVEQVVNTVVNAVSENSSMLIYALIVLIIGLYVCKKVKKIAHATLIKYKVEKPISNFISYGVYVLCLGGLSMICLEMIGIPIKSFLSVLVAIFGAVALSLGLAFKEVLANLGSGIIILLFKPFKIGDYIAGAGVEGTVMDIQLFGTVLSTIDNKTIIVPHLKLTGDNITNYTHQEKRRIDFRFSVSYDSDIKTVKKILQNIFDSDDRIFHDEEILIGLRTFGESGMEIVARPWVKTDEYWDVYFDLMEKVKVEFDKNGIEIPFPTRTVYHKNSPK